LRLALQKIQAKRLSLMIFPFVVDE
jgi:hypothetical protein